VSCLVRSKANARVDAPSLYEDWIFNDAIGAILQCLRDSVVAVLINIGKEILHQEAFWHPDLATFVALRR
jgi:hypothetical protein